MVGEATRNDAVAYLHLNALVGVPIFDRDVSTDSCLIAIDGTKCKSRCEISSFPLARDFDATAFTSAIARDGAVGEGQIALIVDAAAFAMCRIARDGAVGQRERADIRDTTAVAVIV